MRFFASPSILIIDELGYLPLAHEAAAALFQVVTQRYLKGSIVLTTNRGLTQWGQMFNDDNTVAAAMLDRLLHRSTVCSPSMATATRCACTEGAWTPSAAPSLRPEDVPNDEASEAPSRRA